MGRRAVWLLVAVVLGIMLIVFAYPQIKAVRLQSKVGKLIAEYVAQAQLEQSEAVEGIFYCIFPTLHPELFEGNNLDQAILWLNEAKSLAPNNVHSSFLLGQAYCLNEEYQKAIDMFSAYKVNHNNPLVKAEMGWAYLAISLNKHNPGEDSSEVDMAKYYLTNTGFSDIFFKRAAEKAFTLRKFADALRWVELRMIFNGKFDETVSQQYLLDGFTLIGEEGRTIKYDEFYQIKDGSPAPTMLVNGTKVAVLPSNASDIGVMIRVNDSSKYCINLLSVDQKPEPTQLSINLNFKEIIQAELTDGDGSLKSVDTDVFLERGSYLLTVKFLNDYHSTVDGDRNGYVESILIIPCQ